jgi:DNA-binding beta-propeller fold protein YncE
VNTDSKSISSYSIASDGSLALLETTPVNAPTALPADARLSPDGTTLWVVDSGRNTVSGFAVDGGTVTELPDSPTPGPAAAQPIGIVVT